MAVKRGDICTVYRPSAYRGGAWCYSRFQVKVLGVIDGWVMVRRKGAMPFIESVKQLEKWSVKAPGPVVSDEHYDGATMISGVSGV